MYCASIKIRSSCCETNTFNKIFCRFRWLFCILCVLDIILIFCIVCIGHNLTFLHPVCIGHNLNFCIVCIGHNFTFRIAMTTFFIMPKLAQFMLSITESG